MADNDVSVRFGADTQEAISAIQQVQSEIGDLAPTAQNLGGVFGDLKDQVESLAAAFGAWKLVDFVEGARQAAVAIDIMSQRTGIAASTFSALNIPLLQSGSSIEDLSSSMRFLERNITEGSTNTVKALNDLGLSLTKLRSMSPQEQLEAVAQALAENADKSSFMANGISLLGRSFQTQAPFIKNFGANLHEMINNAKTDGDSLSDAVIHEIHRQDDEWISLYEHVKMYVAEMSLGALKVAELNNTPHPSTNVPSGYLSDSQAAAIFNKALNPPNPAAGNNSDLPGSGPDNSSALSNIAANQKIADLQLQQQKDMDAALVAANLITKQQELADDEAFLEQDHSIKQAALQQELALYKQGSDEYKETLNKMGVLDAQFQTEQAKLAQQGAQAQQAALKQTEAMYKGFFDTIDRSMDQMLQGVLQGTQTWQQAWDKMAINMEVTFVEAIAKMLLKLAAFEASQATLGSGSNMSKALGAGVPSSLGGSDSSSALATAMNALLAAVGLNTTATMSASEADILCSQDQLTSSVQSIAQTAFNTTDTAANTLAIAANTQAVGAQTIGQGNPLGFLSFLGQSCKRKRIQPRNVYPPGSVWNDDQRSSCWFSVWPNRWLTDGNPL